MHPAGPGRDGSRRALRAQLVATECWVRALHLGRGDGMSCAAPDQFALGWDTLG